MVTLIRLLQPKNANEPMDVTVLGMTMLVRFDNPLKAPEPIDVMEFGKMIDFRMVLLEGSTLR